MVPGYGLILGMIKLSQKLDKLFPNESKEAIQKLLANAWKQLCNYDPWVVLYLQGIRYTR
jgi:hypothetical protein